MSVACTPGTVDDGNPQGPHLSEKSHFAAENNQVVFKVRKDATKSEIRQAVELLFEVKVDDVKVLSTSKARRSVSA